jgi:hypothetical protein
MRRVHDRMADAHFRFRHVHAERRVDSAFHQSGEERDCQLGVAREPYLRGWRRGLHPAGRRSLARKDTGEFGADEYREGRVVAEVEALELIVAENHDHIRARVRQFLSQYGEAFLDACVLALVRF